jgi:hypothetical protein
VIDQVVKTDYKKRVLDGEKVEGVQAAGKAAIADTTPGAATIAIDLADGSEFMKPVEAATVALGPDYVAAAKKSFQALQSKKPSVSAAEIDTVVKEAARQTHEALDRKAEEDATAKCVNAVGESALDGTVPLNGALAVTGKPLEQLVVNLLGPLAAAKGSKEWVLNALTKHGATVNAGQVSAAVDDLLDRGLPSSTLRVVRPVRRGPQSGQDGIPTQSVGTREAWRRSTVPLHPLPFVPLTFSSFTLFPSATPRPPRPLGVRGRAGRVGTVPLKFPRRNVERYYKTHNRLCRHKRTDPGGWENRASWLDRFGGLG